MTQEQFDFLCEKLGDPDLPVDERWKSIQYIHIHSSYEPMGSFPQMLRRDQIAYFKNDTLGGGFFYLLTPDVAYDPLNNEDYTISWVPLTGISEITFKGFQRYKNADKIFGITDILNEALDANIKPLPTEIKVDAVRIKRENAKEFEPRVKAARPITKNDYDVTYYDSIGNELEEKPITVGTYKVKVSCKGDYIGEDISNYEIY